MHILDIVKGVSLLQKDTGRHADVLRVEGDTVYLEFWDHPTPQCLPMNTVVSTFATLVEPDGLPVFAIQECVSTGEGIDRAVRISTLEPHPAFMDDDTPVFLHATARGRCVLDAYLLAMKAGDAWLDRESGGNAALEDGSLLLCPGWRVALSRETYRKRYPSQWYSVVVFHDAPEDTASDPVLSLTLRDKSLAHQLYASIMERDVVLAPCPSASLEHGIDVAMEPSL